MSPAFFTSTRLNPTVGHFCLTCLSGQRRPTEPGERRRYDREFLLGLQFVSASRQKTKDLPCINGVILDKVGDVCHQLSFFSGRVQDNFVAMVIYLKPQVNETPLPPADPARLMLFLGNLKSKSAGGPRAIVSKTSIGLLQTKSLSPLSPP